MVKNSEPSHKCHGAKWFLRFLHCAMVLRDRGARVAGGSDERRFEISTRGYDVGWSHRAKVFRSQGTGRPLVLPSPTTEGSSGGSRTSTAHYRIEGKILVKREEFDRWVSDSHVVKSADYLTAIKLNRRALPRY